MERRIGETINLPEAWSDFTVTDQIGQGAHGTVYRMEDAAGNVYAVKILRVSKDEQGQSDACSLPYGEPGIVRVLDRRIVSDQSAEYNLEFLQMEYLTDLRTWLMQHVLTEADAICMMADLCDGLESCQKVGILHRDIKPENILITEEGRAKLCDFSVSRDIPGEATEATTRGNFRYMAPELYYQKTCSCVTDLYSLGLVFYTLMNRGRDPFTDTRKQILSMEDREEAFRRRLRGEWFPLPADASPAFGLILQKACAGDPDKRYPDAGTLKQELVRLLKDQQKDAGIHGADRSQSAMFRHLRRRVLIPAIIIAAILLGIGMGQAGTTELLGSCGADATYAIRGKHTLVISGTGKVSVDMIRLTEDQKEEVRTFVAEEGITSLENPMHYGGHQNVEYQNIERLVLPDGLTEIGGYSFQDCTRLKELDVPDTVTEIGDWAFAHCYALTKVSLPDGLETIGRGAFLACNSLQDVSIPDSVKMIGEDAFAYTSWQANR